MSMSICYHVVAMYIMAELNAGNVMTCTSSNSAYHENDIYVIYTELFINH